VVTLVRRLAVLEARHFLRLLAQPPRERHSVFVLELEVQHNEVDRVLGEPDMEPLRSQL
jgi:hypothetical protein